VANLDKPFCQRAVPQAAECLRRLGASLVVDQATAGLLSEAVTTLEDTAAVARVVDVLLVFGGDGTMLRAGRETAGSGIWGFSPVPIYVRCPRRWSRLPPVPSAWRIAR
jgi:NAD kinase